MTESVVIEMDAGTYNGTESQCGISMPSGASVDLTIRGASTGPVTIDCEYKALAMEFDDVAGNILIQGIVFARCAGKDWETGSIPGGAMRFTSSASGSETSTGVVIVNCSFVKASLAGSGWGSRGGALYIDDASPRFEDCDFVSNRAGISVAVYITGTTITRPRFTRCSFIDNVARAGGWGGVTVPEGSSSGVFEHCLFQGNVATFGGAIDDGGESTTLFYACEFVDNRGTLGGVFYGYASAQTRFEKCVFHDSYSTSSGGLMFLSSQVHTVFEDCVIDGALSGADAGVGKVQAATSLTMRRVRITNVEALSNGGALVVGSSGVTVLDDVIISDCISHGEAGAIVVTVKGTGKFEATNLIAERSTSSIAGGGFLFRTTDATTTISMTNVTATENYALESGGGLVVYDSLSRTTLRDVIFDYNTAGLQAGGASIRYPLDEDPSTFYFDMSDVMFVGNSALEGGGLVVLDAMAEFWPDNAAPNLTIRTALFAENRAEKIDRSGGQLSSTSFGGGIYIDDASEGVGASSLADDENCSRSRARLERLVGLENIILANGEADAGAGIFWGLSQDDVPTIPASEGSACTTERFKTTLLPWGVTFADNVAHSWGADAATTIVDFTLWHGLPTPLVRGERFDMVAQLKDKFHQHAKGRHGITFLTAQSIAPNTTLACEEQAADEKVATVIFSEGNATLLECWIDGQEGQIVEVVFSTTSTTATQTTSGTIAVDDRCEAGQYRAEDQSCSSCPAGRYTAEKNRQTECDACERGSAQPLAGQTSCSVCNDESYADERGMEECESCPENMRRDIDLNDPPETWIGVDRTQCQCVEEGFYFDSASFECFECEQKLGGGARCPEGSVLEDVGVDEGYWRGSLSSTRVRNCIFGDIACGGSRPTNPDQGVVAVAGDALCKTGYRGPLCALCDGKRFYSIVTKTCQPCGGAQRRLVAFLVLFAAVLACVGFGVAAWRFRSANNTASSSQSPTFGGGGGGGDFKFQFRVLCDAVFDTARFKIIWASYQIISVIGDVVSSKQAAPSGMLLRMLQFFRFDASEILAPFRCTSNAPRLNYYDQLLVSSLGPMTIVFILFLSVVPRASISLRARGHDPNDPRVWKDAVDATFSEHSRVSVLLTYILYPSTSAKIFSIWHCDREFDSSVGARLASDYSLKCSGSKYRSYVLFATCMILLIPIGIPVCYLCVLWSKRYRINPRHMDDHRAIALRSHDHTLDPYKPLFAHYSPNYWWFEPFELWRRALFVCGIANVGGSHRKALSGTILASGFAVLFRDVKPYSTLANSILNSVCALLIAICYFAAEALIHQDELRVDRTTVASILLVAIVCSGGAAAVAQVRDQMRADVEHLKQKESELREYEYSLDILELEIQLRAKNKNNNIDDPTTTKKQKTDTKKMSSPRPALTRMGGSTAALMNTKVKFDKSAVGLAQKRRLIAELQKTDELVRERRAAAANAGRDPFACWPGGSHAGGTSSQASFDHCAYPCWVISLTNLESLGASWITHEEALGSKLLERLTPGSQAPNPAFTFFISHAWEAPGQPDTDHNAKLRWLQNLRALVPIPPEQEIWIWFDYVSVPQQNRPLQLKAIKSLCSYVQLCSRFIPLIRDDHAEKTEGTFDAYCARGWCRLELLCALAPKKFSTGEWRKGPLRPVFRYYQDPSDSIAGPPLNFDLVVSNNPLDGDFTKIEDKEHVLPLLETIAQRFHEYAMSGSTACDATVNVAARPAWLVAMAYGDFGRDDDDGPPQDIKSIDIQIDD
ncbi:hypothetical protein CTAYLR_005475 [Chrysophaeum taylorii]|uniref:Right handed beta helix domain-containing protein n=1 Tax=Chrysophaeum taylorii TaxID=2483200 RepID=A0AAD7U6P8_9STRA|nr:hypothetical protein CTAYLR_005475 [Chrysophaeum taylorii]